MRYLSSLFFLFPVHLMAQEVSDSEQVSKYVRPKYCELGAGLNISQFRDFATSPLVYSGGAGQFTLGIIRKDERVESNFSFRFSSGIYGTDADRRELTPSVVNSVFFSYGRLYANKGLSAGKWNTKVGGKIDVTGNLRQNKYLLNAGNGIESFQTLFASAKVTRDISRENMKKKKFLFIRYKLKPKKRELSFQVNPSIVNSTYRNGFAYIDQASVTGSNNAFEDYRFSAFSGFRINTALELTRYLKNGNGVKYSYIWDAYKTGGELPRFEMSHHIFQLSLLFRIK